MRRFYLLATLVALVWVCGCGPRKPLATLPSPAPNQAYVDLEPGWRIRVVAPILKSGGFQMKTALANERERTIVVDTAGDFQGFETSYYSVLPSGRVRFVSCEETRDGVTTPITKSRLALFTAPAEMRYFRLAFLERAGSADHDMALIAARKAQDLGPFTSSILRDPVTGCSVKKDTYCAWIPASIAVRPEWLRDGTWKPAR